MRYLFGSTDLPSEIKFKVQLTCLHATYDGFQHWENYANYGIFSEFSFHQGVSYSGFWGSSFARCPYGAFVFSQIPWHVPTFETCEANFSEPRRDTDTMFSLKVAQDPRLHFRRKTFSKKNSASWVVSERIFEQTLFLSVYHLWAPISQNWD